jgi:hypothetical protein
MRRTRAMPGASRRRRGQQVRFAVARGQQEAKHVVGHLPCRHLREVLADLLRMHLHLGAIAHCERAAWRIQADEPGAGARVLEPVQRDTWRDGQLLAHDGLRRPARRFEVEAEVRGRLDLVFEHGIDGGQMHGGPLDAGTAPARPS